jgi:hypothetical protein
MPFGKEKFRGRLIAKEQKRGSAPKRERGLFIRAHLRIFVNLLQKSGKTGIAWTPVLNEGLVKSVIKQFDRESH